MKNILFISMVVFSVLLQGCSMFGSRRYASPSSPAPAKKSKPASTVTAQNATPFTAHIYNTTPGAGGQEILVITPDDLESPKPIPFDSKWGSPSYVVKLVDKEGKVVGEGHWNLSESSSHASCNGCSFFYQNSNPPLPRMGAHGWQGSPYVAYQYSWHKNWFPPIQSAENHIWLIRRQALDWVLEIK